MKITRTLQSPRIDLGALEGRLKTLGYAVLVSDGSHIHAERGSRIAGLYAFDYRKLKTSLDVTVDPIGTVALRFDMHTSLQFVTSSDIAKIEQEIAEILGAPSTGPSLSLREANSNAFWASDEKSAKAGLIMAVVSLFIVPGIGLVAATRAIVSLIYFWGKLDRKTTLYNLLAIIIGCGSFVLSKVFLNRH